MDLSQLPDAFYRVSVKALIFDEKKRLLVSQDAEGFWEIPGGGWDHGETLDECMNRELMEELQAVPLQISPISFTYTKLHENTYHKLFIAVPVTLQPGELIPTDDNLIATKYVTKAELLTLPFQSTEAAIIEHVDQIWADR